MPVLRLPKFGSPVKYAYITGRVRAMKTKLVPAEIYARMMNMDMSEIARYLEETQYKDEIDATTWLISEVTHRLDKAGGFTTDVKMETASGLGSAG